MRAYDHLKIPKSKGHMHQCGSKLIQDQRP